ncbi:MAG: glycerate kinase, partial [Proteobacteria bacterium]|nr:glycerate kinase [Pseudomonadota bacterium]
MQQFLLEMFDAAVESVSAAATVPRYLPPAASGRTIVIGAGKAAASMAQAVESHWSGSLSGRVVTRYGHGVPCESITVVEAAHPVPDTAGQEAAEQILQTVSKLNQDDLVICLISGGGSSLLALPAPGITLKDKQSINTALLKSGATIAEMNCVRKHLSAIKGGKLAAACAPARVVTLIISDVPGDDPAVVASGPTVPDATTLADAQGVLSRYGIDVAENVRRHLASAENETPKPGDPIFKRASTHIIATAQQSLAAAVQFVEQAGYSAVVLGDLEGESREVAIVHAGIARQVAKYGQPAAAPCVILSGG